MAAGSSLQARSEQGTTATIVLPLDGAGESVEAPLQTARGFGRMSDRARDGCARGLFSISLVSDAKMAKRRGNDASRPLGIL